MATKYDEYAALNLYNIGREGFSRNLAPGQYIAWGTPPPQAGGMGAPGRMAPSNITTNIPQVANTDIGMGVETMPSVGRLQQQYRGIDRSQLGAINIPNIPRPSDNLMVNPMGRPMTGAEAMVRGQALRGEGMSVAQRNMMRGQIAGEAGTVSATAKAKQEADALAAQQEYEIRKRQAAWTGEAADTRLKLGQQKAAMDALKQQEAYAQKSGLLKEAEGYKTERLKLQSQMELGKAKELLKDKFGYDIQATKMALEGRITALKASGEIRGKQQEIEARESLRKTLMSDLIDNFATIGEAAAQVDAMFPAIAGGASAVASSPATPATSPAAQAPVQPESPASGDLTGDGIVDAKDAEMAHWNQVLMNNKGPDGNPLTPEMLKQIKFRQSQLTAIKPPKQPNK